MILGLLTFASHAFCGSFGDENGMVEQHNGWLGRGNAELKMLKSDVLIRSNKHEHFCDEQFKHSGGFTQHTWGYALWQSNLASWKGAKTAAPFQLDHWGGNEICGRSMM